MENPIYKDKIIERIGKESFESKLKVLTELDKKENAQGSFKAIEDELDLRT